MVGVLTVPKTFLKPTKLKIETHEIKYFMKQN